MEPREPPALLLIDPPQRRRHDGVCAALAIPGFRRGRPALELVIVAIEADPQAESAVEREAADERRGRETCRLESCGRRRLAGRVAIARVVADAVLVRVAAAQDRGVRRQRDHRMCVRKSEAGTARGQPVQIGRRRPAAVRSQCVGPQGVDRDEEDVAIGIGGEREGVRPEPPPRACRKECEDHQCGRRNDAGRNEARPSIYRRRNSRICAISVLKNAGGAVFTNCCA